MRYSHSSFHPQSSKSCVHVTLKYISVDTGRVSRAPKPHVMWPVTDRTAARVLTLFLRFYKTVSWPPSSQGTPKAPHSAASKENSGNTKAQQGITGFRSYSGSFVGKERGTVTPGKWKPLSLPLANLIPNLFASWRGESPPYFLSGSLLGDSPNKGP